MHKNNWIGTSWKMNKTLAEASQFANALIDAKSYDSIQRFVIPPFTSIREVKSILSNTDIKVGAQNMDWHDSGAWTGEISPPMLTDCGMDIVELGHSERRAHFSENDVEISFKVEAAFKHGLIPLVCVGETLDERSSGQAQKALENQVRGALARVKNTESKHTILFAYEPVWAIGDQGTPASAEYADERQKEIIDLASDLLGRRIPCLYGGSVNPENCAELIDCEHINGLFIGRSAWNVEGYMDILERCNAAIEKG